jgi:hypothetical protein
MHGVKVPEIAAVEASMQPVAEQIAEQKHLCHDHPERLLDDRAESVRNALHLAMPENVQRKHHAASATSLEIHRVTNGVNSRYHASILLSLRQSG